MTEFEPTLFSKHGCPSCFKLRLFLLEAGLLDRFAAREFTPGDENEEGIRAELAPHFEKVMFPTVEVAPGDYRQESDDLVAHYAEENEVDPSSLPLFRTYADTLLPRLRRLNRENKEMVARLEGLAAQD